MKSHTEERDMSKITYETIFYPGRSYGDVRLQALTNELRDVAKTCFDSVPNYQALTGEREEMKRAIICVARDEKRDILGFCSSLVLEVPLYGDVLHTGLTCVAPKARGKKLTHKLTSKILLEYLVKESPFSSVWVTNCACVLSSLGSVALYFEDIYPSPFGKSHPSKDYSKIAQYISENFRKPIAINDDAVFNPKSFVFEGSVKGAVFAKDGNDARFFHRNKKITSYYQNLLDFERGDEVLQIGKVSLMTFPKYLWNTSKRKSSFLKDQLAGMLTPTN